MWTDTYQYAHINIFTLWGVCINYVYFTGCTAAQQRVSIGRKKMEVPSTKGGEEGSAVVGRRLVVVITAERVDFIIAGWRRC